MVVLSLLVAGISQRPLRVDRYQDGTAAAGHLQRMHSWECLRWLVTGTIPLHGLVSQPGAQDGYAALCTGNYAHYACWPGAYPLASGRSYQPRNCRASSMVGQSLDSRFG